VSLSRIYASKRQPLTKPPVTCSNPFDNTLPRYRVKKRIKDYVDYLNSGDWEYEMGSGLPIVLLICPSLAELIYTKRRARTLLDEGQDDEDIHIRVATSEQVKRQGVTAKIWEEA